MSSSGDSPLLKALISVGAKLVVEDFAERCKDIENSPIGAFVRSGLTRSKQLREQGKPWTESDVEELLMKLPNMKGQDEDGGEAG